MRKTIPALLQSGIVSNLQRTIGAYEVVSVKLPLFVTY